MDHILGRLSVDSLPFFWNRSSPAISAFGRMPAPPLRTRLEKSGPPFALINSFANVLLVQFRVKSRRSRVARNRAQVGVDREEVAVGHVRICRPWHHLKKFAIERKGQVVVRRAGTATARMNVIEILPVPYDLYELLKSMPSLLSGVRFLV